jgi:hypothetical protein
MGTIDRLFGWLLVLGAALHALGSVTGYGTQPELLVWSLSGTLAALLLAVLNLMRAGRPTDRTLALVCLVGSIAWVAVALGFGAAIGDVLDPRALIHAVNAGVLAVFSIRTLLASGRHQP